MARIRQLNREETSEPMQAEYDKQIAAHGRMTNMKRTLGHSTAAFHALMEFYPLFDEVQPFLGRRGAMLFTHAISSETDCLICSTFFRRILVDGGEDPDDLRMDEREKAVVEYGRQLVKNPNGVSDALFARLQTFFDERQIVALTALGGIMIATNIFNNALKVDLDEYLFPYRRERTQARENV